MFPRFVIPAKAGIQRTRKAARIATMAGTMYPRFGTTRSVRLPRLDSHYGKMIVR